MSLVKYTKTSTFLFPLLEIPKALFTCNVKTILGKQMFTLRFINSYLFDENVALYRENCIFLLIKNYRDVDFETFYSTMRAFPNYRDSYEKNNYLIMVYSVSEEMLPDYTLILNGKYSEISAAAKKLILSNHFFSGKAFTLPLILNKSESLKDSWEDRLSSPTAPAYLYDQEVWPIIDRDVEKLDNNMLKEFAYTDSKLEPSGEFN